MKTLITRFAPDARGRAQIKAIPEGWSILRQVHETHTEFSLFERNGDKWPSGEPRAALDVTVYHPGHGREEATVSWPSTSDKRPVLARTLAVALRLAAAWAEEETARHSGPGERGTA